MKAIVSARIKNARIQKQMSLQQVAAHLNVSKQMVNKYEQGKTMPDSRKLIALGDLFEKKVDYFFRQPEVHIGAIDFRKKSKFSNKKVQALKEEIRVQIENYLLIEDICGLNSEFKDPISKLSIRSKQDVVKAVNEIRSAWRIGNDPIHNIIELLEDHEVKVIEVQDASMQFDGLATRIDEKYLVVVVNENMPIERKRFTLLHELGHLVLNMNDSSEKVVEKYCNWFASEMLLSAENMRVEFGDRRSNISMEELKNVQSKYGISIQAIVYKLGEEGVIPDGKVAEFYRKLNANADLRAEVDRSRFSGNESSIRFKNLVYRSLSEEAITISKASSLLNTDLNSLRHDLSSINVR